MSRRGHQIHLGTILVICIVGGFFFGFNFVKTGPHIWNSPAWPEPLDITVIEAYGFPGKVVSYIILPGTTQEVFVRINYFSAIVNVIFRYSFVDY